jgi:hypothetical protein
MNSRVQKYESNNDNNRKLQEIRKNILYDILIFNK